MTNMVAVLVTDQSFSFIIFRTKKKLKIIVLQPLKNEKIVIDKLIFIKWISSGLMNHFLEF